jgi:hypothetical protein
MDSKRVEELKHIRDDLEIYGAKCELVRRANTGNVYFDKDIYGMFGSIGETEARSIARGITFALMGLDDGIDHGYVDKPREIEFVNPGDWSSKFWKHNYLVTVTAQGIQFFVNADCEQNALDELIDFCEDRYPGLASDGADLDEDEREEYFCGGNHGLYLTTDHIQIKEV